MLISSAGLLILKFIQYKKNHNEIILDKDEELSEEFLNAKEIFVRDPLSFKDKNKDGIDDIVDKNV